MNIKGNNLTISVIVPVYNGGNQFRLCLESIAKAVPTVDEVIVVADGDTDNSCLLASELGMKVIRLSQSQGPATARKRGWLFTCGVILWHWLYYFYSGLAFGISLIRYYFSW